MLPEHSCYGFAVNSCSEPVYVSSADGLKALYVRQLKKNQIYGGFLGIKQWGRNMCHCLLAL